MSGEFIKTFDSIKDAALFAHINPNNISRVCRGERRSAGGYKWQYLDPPKKIFKGTRAIEQYNLDNELIANFPSIQEATRKTGICKSSIQCACCGKQKTAGGFIWKYIE